MDKNSIHSIKLYFQYIYIFEKFEKFFPVGCMGYLPTAGLENLEIPCNILAIPGNALF